MQIQTLKIAVVVALALIAGTLLAIKSNALQDDPFNQATSTESTTSLSTTSHATSTASSTSGTSTQPVTTSGISGIVTIGPTCPVMRDPPDPGCNDRPYAATIAINQNGKTVKIFSSNNDGTFFVALKPGTYELSKADNGPVLPTLYTQTVIVKPGAITKLTIQFDSGIR